MSCGPCWCVLSPFRHVGSFRLQSVSQFPKTYWVCVLAGHGRTHFMVRRRCIQSTQTRAATANRMPVPYRTVPYSSCLVTLANRRTRQLFRRNSTERSAFCPVITTSYLVTSTAFCCWVLVNLDCMVSPLQCQTVLKFSRMQSECFDFGPSKSYLL